MASTGNNTNNASDPSTNNNGGSSHRKLKGAAEVVHGIGENIRGRLMDAVDSSTNSEAAHPEVEEGGHEIEHGMARLTGGPGVENPRRTRVSDETNTGKSPPLAQEGNVLGPASGLPAGVHAGPVGGPQYSSPGGAAPVQGGRNDRDFHPGSADRAQEDGPAPDRNALSRSPPNGSPEMRVLGISNGAAGSRISPRGRYGRGLRGFEPWVLTSRRTAS